MGSTGTSVKRTGGFHTHHPQTFFLRSVATRSISPPLPITDPEELLSLKQQLEEAKTREQAERRKNQKITLEEYL
ncbi:hypothetical protein CDV36_015521 [Fusarium kuroshium]|uniref:Uncharacterized protein n=2 Tax=Fusarium solani species complex TaxID=232080 RepID=A0A3M2RAI9_9HYPO|nr:hypothetical protein CDV36_015521 [Fusarium kuroshium]RSL51417.1 hypothetical protein CEP51_015214 [Fusarium floridanum]